MLPICHIRLEILDSLDRCNRLVLTAPTGSGKTTQVPQFLLQAGQADENRQVIVLQPRRLAARLMAQRVAAEVGTNVGETVGYQTRHESRVGPRTAIRFMTEGLFLRILQSNPKLDGIAAVILDEFHERNLATDTALALTKALQENGRPDLRLIVMSATLDTQRVGEYLACPVLEAHGRMYPVDVRYMARSKAAGRVGTYDNRRGTPVWELAGDALADVLATSDQGDVLIFMPGGYEIRRTIEECRRVAGGGVAVFPLYSELPATEQDAALAPSSGRKVIVSTNVAETSITIEGIRHVIDSGLARINRFDARRGINVLMIEPISQASAEQRAGRAGRTAPGTCIRLWAESEQRHRPAHTTPEIRRLDLAEVVLQLHSMGVGDVAAFPWLEPPAAEALELAQTTLTELDALSPTGELTKLGAAMARLPMHPRLSRMMVEAARRGCLQRAALWAALISERDILMARSAGKFAESISDEFPRSDFLVLEAAMDFARAARFDLDRCASRGIHANAAREVDRTARLYLDSASDNHPPRTDRRHEASARDSVLELAKCLLVAFPDHLARRRSETNLACAMTQNRRGQLDPESIAEHVGLVLPLEIVEVNTPGAKPQSGAGAAQTVRTVLSLATEIDPQWLHELHPDRIRRERATEYDPDMECVQTVQREVFEGLAINESPAEIDKTAAADLLAEQVLTGVLKLDRWDETVDQWIARVRCVAEWFPERKLVAYDQTDLRLILHELCMGATRYKQIQDRPVLPHFRDALSWEDQQLIDKMAPERYQLPRGWRMKITYAAGQQPRARAKIQDLYGLNQSPVIAAGRVKLLLEILAPNMRPVQVTEDLANFWKELYPTVKKELSRRYPRHEWR